MIAPLKTSNANRISFIVIFHKGTQFFVLCYSIFQIPIIKRIAFKGYFLLVVGALLKKEDAKVTAFVRFEVGEGIEKESQDFAAEVANQLK